MGEGKPAVEIIQAVALQDLPEDVLLLTFPICDIYTVISSSQASRTQIQYLRRIALDRTVWVALVEDLWLRGGPTVSCRYPSIHCRETYRFGEENGDWYGELANRQETIYESIVGQIPHPAIASNDVLDPGIVASTQAGRYVLDCEGADSP
ncbi:hypothetical protein C8R44DRAFT_744597 [Mycena epipterygia]|nr:hypothetical protein C8R44DRAFT_744597 [Mycena epipterygia]